MRLKDIKEAPPGGWVIHPMISGREIRLPHRGAARSFNALVNHYKQIMTTVGEDVFEPAAQEEVHRLLCRDRRADCTNRPAGSKKAAARKTRQPTRRHRPVVRGGCSSCGGGRRR